ncbi:hypothetical protein CN198_30060 [Sinorhizobium meliloti]|nr:hypothetical protein CN198_30060 [Sinorhizobium meliloti]RVK63015.1 hypothetical protein CN159_29415 [Sinorhizobium meliloti]
MNAFCASENCDAFIVFRSFPSQENAPENSNQNWSSLKGSDQRWATLLWFLIISRDSAGSIVRDGCAVCCTRMMRIHVLRD